MYQKQHNDGHTHAWRTHLRRAGVGRVLLQYDECDDCGASRRTTYNGEKVVSQSASIHIDGTDYPVKL